jgi:Choline/Carnitine o-acyltransferase
VTNNGKAAMIAEHSMMDGMPVVVCCNYITGVTYADAKKRSSFGPRSSGNVQDIFSNAMEHIDRSVVEKLEVKGKRRLGRSRCTKYY